MLKFVFISKERLDSKVASASLLSYYEVENLSRQETHLFLNLISSLCHGLPGAALLQ